VKTWQQQQKMVNNKNWQGTSKIFQHSLTYSLKSAASEQQHHELKVGATESWNFANFRAKRL